MITSGTLLGDGRYALERRLGAGGMASVWLAHDERLDRRVAIKVIADTLAGDPQWAGRFMQEARAAAAVSHPNVVSVFDYGLEDERPYLVMAYVAGRDLAAHLRDPDAAIGSPVGLADELLQALGAVHAAGIVHRDVKAANVLVDANGRALLADFGIARAADSTSLTQTGMVIGTVRYLAPELAAGHPATTSSDLFAAGVLLREIVAATGPSEALSSLADALTRPDPADRPASCEDALRLLHGGVAEDAPTATLTLPVDLAAPTRTEDAAGASSAAVVPEATHVQPLVKETGPRRKPRRAAAAGEPDLGRSSAPTTRTSSPRQRTIALAVAAVLVLVLVVALAVGTGGSGSESVRSPADADAPISRQVDTLESIVDDAAGD